MLLVTISQILNVLISVLLMLIIIQFIIGLLFAFNVINHSNQFVAQVYQSIDTLLRPILDPIRRIMPQAGAIDFSPLVLIIGLQILGIIVDNLAYASV